MGDPRGFDIRIELLDGCVIDLLDDPDDAALFFELDPGIGDTASVSLTEDEVRKLREALDAYLSWLSLPTMEDPR